MQPEHGVRFELRLDAKSEGGVRYALTVELPAGRCEGIALIGSSGEVRIEWSGEPPPDYAVAAARAQLRLLYRDHAKDGAYPRRLTRWRPAATATSGHGE